MLYRRKVLLALLEALGRQKTKTDLQKLLFLLSMKQDQPSYHFVPYRFGCYSFSLDADKRALTKHGLLKDCDMWALASRENYQRRLPQSRRLVPSNQTRARSIHRGVWQYPKSVGDVVQ